MAEPMSSGVGVATVIKVYGMWFLMAIAAIAVVLGYLVVIMTRMPRTRSEWVVSLITTVVGSIAGGGFLIQHFELHDYLLTWSGLCAIGGIFFAAGLPFWAIIRWTFNYVNAREDATIFDVAKEMKNYKDNF
ncbi:hypothetical protein EAH57_15500 [Acinetobacter sp. 2JN-4]|uniref:hypothetical protein n=1 Tax=Acinetobacter sp. 2JN-4 TaxID=2479844 RepID=UPI000EF9ECD8|nr:hypothetical protein [Acinetobacter sp. 2JN-4]RLZ06641.1 hypothetical protein EAH57_15500 [Acinetobacter sp. 2JN-4]